MNNADPPNGWSAETRIASDTAEAKRTFSNLIQHFQERYAALTDAQRRLVGIWDLRTPCQIRVYWVGPLHQQLITIAHSNLGENGDVGIFGPLAYTELDDVAEKSLADPIWDAPASHDPGGHWATGEPDPDEGPQTLRDIHLQELGAFLRNVRVWAFRPRLAHEGLGTGSVRAAEISYVEWWGPLDEKALLQEVDGGINQAIQEKVRRRDAPPYVASAPQPYEPTKWNGAWTHLYPAIRIGSPPSGTLHHAMYGKPQDPMNRNRAEFRRTLDDQVLYTHDGFVAAQMGGEETAVRILNMIAFVLRQRGFACEFIGPGDYGHFKAGANERGDYHQFSGMSFPKSPLRSKPGPSTSWWERRWLGDKAPWRLSDEEFAAVAREALRWSASPVADAAILLLEADTLLTHSRYTNSFILSWFVVERFVNEQVVAFLSSSTTPTEIASYVLKRQIGDLISLLAKAPPRFQLMNPERAHTIRDRRNKIMHAGVDAAADWARDALDYARELVNSRQAAE